MNEIYVVGTDEAIENFFHFQQQLKVKKYYL